MENSPKSKMIRFLQSQDFNPRTQVSDKTGNFQQRRREKLILKILPEADKKIYQDDEIRGDVSMKNGPIQLLKAIQQNYETKDYIKRHWRE